MLIGIDPRITPDLLHVLARMGHGDELVVADANYPAAASARTCVVPEVQPMAGLDAVSALQAIATLLPLESFGEASALRMEVDGAPDDLADVHREAWDALRPKLPTGGRLASIERQAFYARARDAFAVVATGETRAFGCFILRKGVVF